MTKDPQAALLKIIRDAQASIGEDGTITTKELAGLMDCGIDKARGVIHALVEAGKMEPIKSPRKQVTGVISPTWAFRLVE